ncbi:MAG: hypothetical protein WAT78_02715 [Rhizobiaceae bacterium]
MALRIARMGASSGSVRACNDGSVSTAAKDGQMRMTGTPAIFTCKPDMAASSLVILALTICVEARKGMAKNRHASTPAAPPSQDKPFETDRFTPYPVCCNFPVRRIAAIIGAGSRPVGAARHCRLPAGRGQYLEAKYMRSHQLRQIFTTSAGVAGPKG